MTKIFNNFTYIIIILSFFAIGCNVVKKGNRQSHFTKSKISKSKHTGTSSNFHPLHFVNEKTGWAVFSKGEIYKTTDGGLNWEEQTSNTKEALYSIWFYNEQIGLAVGSNAIILATNNGGKEWQNIEPPLNTCLTQKSNIKETLFYCQFMNEDICYANGNYCLHFPHF
jgi:photosystem II stability/assembly factor-like uncharacterized protein